MKAVIDVDEVVLQWGKGFDKYLRTYHNYTGEDIATTSKSLHDLNVHQYVQQFNVSKEFANLEPVDNAIYTLNLLILNGYDIAFISACGDSNETFALRMQNLELYLDFTYDLYCIPLDASKHALIDELQPTLYIDDNAENVKAAMAHTPSVYHMATPYNTKNELFKYIHSWKEISY